MSNKKQQLICITGFDGGGKSTLIENLLKQFPNAVECSVWDAFSDANTPLFSSKQLVDDYVCALTPNARTLFFMHGLLFAIEKAMKSGAEYVFINAYYYKYFASELCLGANTDLINRLITFFPEVPKTIYLKVKPEIAVQRKQQFSFYECGCNIPDTVPFIDFQTKMNLFFKQFIQPDWLILDAIESSEMLVQKTVEFILN